MATRLAPRPILPATKPPPQPITLPPRLATNCVLDLQTIQSTKWVDRSGHGNHGTNYGATPTAKGRNGFAWEFDGVDDKLDCGNDASLNLTTSFSISAWINVTTWTTNNGIVTRMTASHVRNWVIYLYDNNEIGVLIGTGADYDRITSAGNNLDVNQWIHITYTYDGTSRLYINGAVQANTSTAVLVGLQSTPLNIGVKYTSNASPFEGLIDEVNLFTIALSASDISALYEAGKP